jgi:hypothetical protein
MNGRMADPRPFSTYSSVPGGRYGSLMLSRPTDRLRMTVTTFSVVFPAVKPMRVHCCVSRLPARNVPILRVRGGGPRADAQRDET